MRKKTIFCVYCGSENNSTQKRCNKCHRKINPKENLFLDYLKSHLSNELSENIENKTINIIINYIKSHLYGVILTMSIIIVGSTAIVTSLPDYEIVFERPIIASCTPKKFNNKYSYVYSTKDECVSKGNESFIEVFENIDDSIFTYSCEEIIDECGEMWYGVYFNRWVDGEVVKVYH